MKDEVDAEYAEEVGDDEDEDEVGAGEAGVEEVDAEEAGAAGVGAEIAEEVADDAANDEVAPMALEEEVRAADRERGKDYHARVAGHAEGALDWVVCNVDILRN